MTEVDVTTVAKLVRKGDKPSRAISRFLYIQRKVAHMERMGIPAQIVRGACPSWIVEEREEMDRRRGRRVMHINKRKH